MSTPGTSATPVFAAPRLPTADGPTALDGRAAGVMTLLCLLWAAQQVSLKAVAGQASPMLMVVLRSLIALGLLAVLMRHRGERPLAARRGAGAAAGVLFGLEFLLVTEALRLTDASHVVVFLYTAPIFAALGLHWRLEAERLVAGQWAGIALAFAGIMLAFLGGAERSAGAATTHTLLGDGLALMAGAAWGATTVTIRGSSLASAPATEMLLYQLLGAVVLLVPVAWWTGQWHFEPSPLVWAHLGFQSVIVSFASFLTWCWLLRRYLAAPLGVFSLLTPLFGVVLGVALLGESLRPSFVAGSGLVLAGVALVNGHAAVSRALAGLRRPVAAVRRRAARR